MKHFFSFILILITLTVSADDKQYVDSLLKTLDRTKDDSTKVKRLNYLSRYYVDLKIDSAMAFAEHAFALAGKLQWKRGLMLSGTTLGRCFWKKGQFQKARKLHQDALKIAIDLNEKSHKAFVLTCIAQDYADDGKFNEALEYSDRAIKSYTEQNDSAAIADTYLLISWIYKSMGDNSESSKYNLYAMRLYEVMNNDYGTAVASANIGEDFIMLKKYQDAIKYINKGNDICLKNRDFVNVSGNQLLLCDIYLQLNEINNAIVCVNKAIVYGRYVDDYISLGNAYSKLADIYFQQKTFESSAKNLELAIQNYKRVNAGKLLATNYAMLAITYVRLNKTNEAEVALDSAKYYNSDLNSLTTQELFFKGRQLLDSLNGDWKNAYSNYYKYISIRDSIYNEKNTTEIVKNQMQYEYEKKEAVEKVEREKKDIRQRTIRNSIAAVLAGSLIFLIVVYRQRNKISKARKRSDELLLNILPEEVADELKENGVAEAKQFNEVTVMFTDFKGFTQISEKLSPSELVNEIHNCFKEFDLIIGKYKIEKIKTIGDSYMCAGGLPIANKTHGEDVVYAALEIQRFMQKHQEERKHSGKEIFELRIGIHSGPVVAGIVGVKKFAYDIWGDTVNIASRMESSGETGKVNISGATYNIVKDKFKCIHRGKISAKNKGEIDMYFIETI